MPIDFGRIANDWSVAWRAQSRLAARALMLLGPWLADRLQQLELLDRRSRAWPTYVFEGRALSVRLVATQLGIVQPHGSAGAAAAAPFLNFGRSFGRIGQAVEDEWVLPGVLDTVQRVLALIDASLTRWSTPHSQLFDPRTAGAGDIFGILGMAWRGLVSALPQLRAAAQDIRNTVGALRATPGAGGSAGGVGNDGSGASTIALPAEAPSGSTGSGLERWLVAAILVLPALPDLIETLLRAAWITARTKVLDLLQFIERKVFYLRATVLRKIVVELPLALREVPGLAAAMGAIVVWNIRYFARLAQVWFDLVVFGLELFLRTVNVLVNAVLGLINRVLALVDSILHFDLLSLIKPMLGPAGTLVDMMGVRLTPDDLIDAGGFVVNRVAYYSLKAAVRTARAAVYVMSGISIQPVGSGFVVSLSQAGLLHKLSLIENVIDALFADTGGRMTETAAPVLMPMPMPNFYDELFGAPPATLAQPLRAFGARLAGEAGQMFEGIQARLTDLAGVFDRTAADLARTGPAGHMARLARESSGLVDDLYGDQVRELGSRIAARPAASFEQWLVNGGFNVIGAAIPVYVREMRLWWQQEAAAGNAPVVHVNPTSPHILLRRARLARVHLPRLVLRAAGRAHTEDLVRELALAFRSAVQTAYSDGQRQLDTLKASAAASAAASSAATSAARH